MSDTGDTSDRPVHPDPPPAQNEDEELHRVLREAAAASAAQSVSGDAEHDPHDQELSAADLDAGLSLAAALSDLPPGDDLDHTTPQFDPDTLANLAALSRIGPDDDEGEGEGVAHAEGHVVDDADHDYSSLMIPQTSTLTSEQVQEFVDNLGAGDREEEEEEEEEDRSRAATPASTRPEETPMRDILSEIGTPRSEVPSESRTYYEDGKLKRRRNRTVLSCTECHRRKREP